MKKNISVKFLVPVVLIVFSATAVIATRIAYSVETEIINSASNEMKTGTEKVLSVMKSTNEVLTNEVSSAMNMLKEKGLAGGKAPELGSSVQIKNETAPELILQGKPQSGNYGLVDQIKKLTGASATLFVRSGDDFVRISTNIAKDNGERAVGTKLDPNGKAIQKIRNGESFLGAAEILGMPYLAKYEPIFNSQNQVIGIWFVGYPVTGLRFVGELIKNTKIAQNGFLALVDNKGRTLFNSESVSLQIVDDVLKNKISGWSVKKEKFDLWGYTIAAAYPDSDIDSEVSSERLNYLIFGSLLALILTGVIYALVRYQIIKPVLLLSNASAKAADGDYSASIEIKSEDELGRLSSSFNKMINNIKSAIDELHNKKEEAETAVEQVHKAKEDIEGREKYLKGQTVNILREMDKFSQGDLSAHLQAEKNDEVGSLISGFNSVVDKIRTMVSEVQQAVHAAASAGNEISSSSEQMASAAQQQAQQISEIATAVDQMTRTILDSTQNATLSSEKAKTAGKKALEGGNAVKDTIEGMDSIAKIVAGTASTIEELGQSSSQIGEIVSVIEDIADQTNLLALNAAIEAARAGEQGRGFAVVADEVRKLAERTTKATQEISNMILKIQDKTGGVVEAIRKGKDEVEKRKLDAYKAGDVLNEIIENTNEVSSIIEQLAAASEEQSATSEQISKNIESINEVTQQSAVGIQEVARAAEDLGRLNERLEGLISFFKMEKRTLALK
ncbi:MAG: methyl-accepting chemotaxis protein [Bacteroidota bacterium]|nr:methyl-accepting chemotaxis protein [Bacteroidota bacterium]